MPHSKFRPSFAFILACKLCLLGLAFSPSNSPAQVKDDPLVFQATSKNQTVARPNIILIMADDLGVEGLGCYGGKSYATPHLDQLAAEGLRFEHAYAQPLCTNTRLQLMTGFYNDRNWLYFGILPPESKTIGHFMKAAGYRSLITGKWQLQSYDPPDYPDSDKRRGRGMHPRDAGFDHYALFHSLHTEDKGSRYADPTWLQDGELKTDQGGYGPDAWTNTVLDFIAEPNDRPFFVYYPMALPHWPSNPTPHSEFWKDPSRRLEEDPAYLADMIEYMDHCVGRIVSRVDELGLSEDTLILFYSDNGTHRGVESETGSGVIVGGKGLTTNAGTHVPLIARWQGKIRNGTSDHLIDSTDFIPTILEAAGQSLPKQTGIDGISFYPELMGKADVSARRWIYSFYDPRPGWDKDQFSRHVSVRDRRWKLYRDGRLFDVAADPLESTPSLPDSDTNESKVVRRRLKTILDTEYAKGKFAEDRAQ